MKTKGTVILFTLAFLLGASLFIAGCELKGKDEGAQLPTRGYGTFKMHIEDLGPVREVNEAGQFTGRRGFNFDADEDGVAENFYQIDKPTGGIVALSFDQVTGEANGGLPVAMQLFRAGQQDYEIPLQSLTSWIKIDQALGYRRAQYVDQPDILVYEDRIADKQLEAPMTGARKTFEMQLASRGVVNPTASGTSSLGGGDPLDDDNASDGKDNSPAALGDVDAHCRDYGTLCDFEKSCGIFASGWKPTDCEQKFFSLAADAHTAHYFSCVRACQGGGCQAFPACQKTCLNDNLPDVYGCPGQNGPEITDLIYVVKRGGQVFRVDKGFSVQDGDQLAIFAQYIDTESDFGGGQLVVAFNGHETTLPAFSHMGRTSFDDKLYIGFTVSTPLASGTYDFTMHLVDGGCGNVGHDVTGSFRSGGQQKSVSGQLDASMPFEMFEVYDTVLDKFNLGQGFIDVLSIQLVPNSNFLYELMQFDVAIVQAYIWTFTNMDTFAGLTWQAINQSIFTTTHDIHGSKFDESDDTEAMAFYIDQPMSSGLFTFYGDEGWNIYPIAPYGNTNTTQPFMRGDFASTRIKIPFHPISQVSLQYTGCADTCDYWVNYIYDTGHKTVPGFATRDEAIAACQGNSADGFWRGLFTCYKKAAATINGCISLDSCLSALPNPGSSGKLCDHAQDVPLNVRVKVDPAYVGSDTYGPLIANANGRLKVGAIAQNATSGTWMALPGTYQDFVYGKTDYALSLAYMPLVPNDFMQIANINGVQQSQMYIAIFDLDAHTGNATPYGEGLYPKNDVVTQGDWFYLLVYSYNWTDPEQEGWTLGFVSGSTIYGWANPYETIVDLTFGDLRVTGTTILQP